MAWKLWRLTALLTALLAATGAAVDISIIGGSEVNIGDKAEIQCSYTEFFLYLPNFIINGVTIESGALETQLIDYNQSHNWTCTDGCSATYTLTLTNVSRGYNGTTYQCSVGSEGAVKSGIVTLIVRDPPAVGTSSAKEGTAGTEPSDAPSDVNMVVGSVTGVTVYLLTIILIGLVIHFGVKANKNRSKGNRPALPPTPPPPPTQVVKMTHNPVYGGIPAPPAYVEHIDFAGNRDVLVNMDVRYHDVPGRKSVAVESLYDYVQ